MTDYFNISQAPNSANLVIYPSSDYDVSMVSYGANGHFECVNEVWNSPNEDTDYVSHSSDSVVSDWYGCTNHTTESGTINYVRVITRGKAYAQEQMSTGDIYLLVDDTSSTDKSSNKAPMNISYRKYYHTWATKPSGGVWTWTDIDNMRIGLQISSPSYDGGTGFEVLNPSGAGDLTEWSPSAGANWECVRPGGGGTVECSNDYDLKDLYNIQNHSTSSFGTISGVTVHAKVKSSTAPPDRHMKLLLKINGTIYESAVQGVTNSYTWVTNKWSTNPDSSASWEWDDIDDLQIGIFNDDITAHTMSVDTVYSSVSYNYSGYPELRFTQEYAVVNYTPDVSTISLSIPDQLSVSHNRNISRFNFPDGDYEIADMGRTGKSLNLSGIEYNSTVSDMQSLKDMCHYSSAVNITNLPDSNLNTDYLIRSFSWEDISYNNETQNRTYRWNLTLEEC